MNKQWQWRKLDRYIAGYPPPPLLMVSRQSTRWRKYRKQKIACVLSAKLWQNLIIWWLIIETKLLILHHPLTPIEEWTTIAILSPLIRHEQQSAEDVYIDIDPQRKGCLLASGFIGRCVLLMIVILICRNRTIEVDFMPWIVSYRQFKQTNTRRKPFQLVSPTSAALSAIVHRLCWLCSWGDHLKLELRTLNLLFRNGLIHNMKQFGRDERGLRGKWSWSTESI